MIIKRNLNLLVLTVISCLILFSSCKKEKQPIPEVSSVKISEVDKNMFTYIKKAGDVYDKNEIWNGYDFSKQPYFLVFRDKDEKPTKGYILNPHKNLEGIGKIASNQKIGLNIVAYNKQLEEANKDLKSENGVYSFEFKIQGGKYAVFSYSEKEFNNLNEGVRPLLIHELFHVFQNKWQLVEGAVQDEKNYPITKELLPLQLLFYKMSKSIMKEKDPSRLKEYLKMYVSIRSKEMQLDPSAAKLVKNFANNQESGEGTARYVEVAALNELYPGNKNIGIAPEFKDLEKTFPTAKDFRGFAAWGIWYNTGEAVVHMLKTIGGVDVEKQHMKGKNLYQLAEGLVQLSNSDKAIYLAKAKSEFNWQAIVSIADKLLALK
ncbi:hypothetical protein DMA11_07540 [Marinilabiliaceae bacterium JC017]|nr:hypothetical protein DMA11_07540 [Marinilabiliaceae bacterium JC017]